MSKKDEIQTDMIEQDSQSEEKAVNSGEFSDQFKFYKSRIAGLSVQVGAPERDEVLQAVHFTSYLMFDEVAGEHYRLGVLATDEPDVIEVLTDDVNAVEITEPQYREILASARKDR